jgi:magnesium-transporting ATPase (P-type)
MVTGDHPTTAEAIARDVGIFTSEHKTVRELAEQRGVPVEEVDPSEADVRIGSEFSSFHAGFFFNFLCVFMRFF